MIFVNDKINIVELAWDWWPINRESQRTGDIETNSEFLAIVIRTKNLHHKVKSSIKHKYQLGKNALVFVNMLSRANFQTYGSSDALMDEIVNFVHLQPMLEDSWLLGSIPLTVNS